jgi:hypothetical protein
MPITITVTRPMVEDDVFVIKERGGRGFTIFPDGNERNASDFPLSGVSLYYSHRKHFILANEHRERWILSDIRSASLDLNVFSPEWQGCSVHMVRH